MENKKIVIVLVILSFLIMANILIFGFYAFQKEFYSPNDERSSISEEPTSNSETFLNKSEALSLKNFIELNIELSESVLIMKDKIKECQGIVVAIDSLQAYSIQQGIESKISLRPLSHDTIRDILEQYNISVVMMKITEFKNGIYLGRLILSDGNKIVNLDIRPSDGIAVAVRVGAPIYISKSLFDELKENLC